MPERLSFQHILPDRRTTATADDIDTMREMADFSYRQ